MIITMLKVIIEISKNTKSKECKVNNQIEGEQRKGQIREDFRLKRHAGTGSKNQKQKQ